MSNGIEIILEVASDRTFLFLLRRQIHSYSEFTVFYWEDFGDSNAPHSINFDEVNAKWSDSFEIALDSLNKYPWHRYYLNNIKEEFVTNLDGAWKEKWSNDPEFPLNQFTPANIDNLPYILRWRVWGWISKTRHQVELDQYIQKQSMKLLEAGEKLRKLHRELMHGESGNRKDNE